MGGGAGIKFEVEIDQFYVKRAKNNKRKFRVVEPPNIARWSMLGYDDGMSNICGDLLKVEVAIHDIAPDEVDWINNYSGIRTGDRLAAWVDEKQWPNIMVWRGYVRGSWEDLFPLSLPFELTIEAFGVIKADLVIEPSNREIFRYFWKEVFEFDPEYSGDMDISRHDLRVNYGAQL